MTKKVINKIIEVLATVSIMMAGLVTVWQAFNLNVFCIGAIALFVGAVVLYMIVDDEES